MFTHWYSAKVSIAPDVLALGAVADFEALTFILVLNFN